MAKKLTIEFVRESFEKEGYTLLSKEYINAEQTLGDGISLFENEHESSGFESDKNVGKLYSDLGDLNYFISLQFILRHFDFGGFDFD